MSRRTDRIKRATRKRKAWTLRRLIHGMVYDLVEGLDLGEVKSFSQASRHRKRERKGTTITHIKQNNVQDMSKNMVVEEYEQEPPTKRRRMVDGMVDMTDGMEPNGMMVDDVAMETNGVTGCKMGLNPEH